MDIRYASHPNEVKQFDTERLQSEFQINDLFVANEIKLVYSHVDRFIIGGVLPITGSCSCKLIRKKWQLIIS